MTPHKKFTLIFWLAATSILLISYFLLSNSQSKLIQSQAIRVAEIVANQVLMDRKAYTELLVEKLERDGTGASVNAHELEGFIPLPAQFVRAVADNIAASESHLYQYRLMSAWNLNPNQGINSEYEASAWAELMEQEVQHKKTGSGNVAWKPFVRFEETAGGLVLRYMRADTASAMACVTCHNAYEHRPDIIAFREANGITAGKQWKLGELMGGIHVDVPLRTFEEMAESDRLAMFLAILITCIIGFGGLYRLIYIQVIRPVEEEAKAKNSFLAKMSHEIRTPLNAVINMGEFLKEGNLDKDQQQHLRMLNVSSQQLLALVDDILDFSKLEGGGLQTESIPFDLKELVKSCSEAFFIEAMHKGVALDLDIGPDVEDYYIGDPARIRQVLQNLIQNAVKFTEEGEITVSLETSQVGVTISVNDTGIGIAKDRQKAVLQDFTQGDNSVSRAYGGTGLGLTISKGLVELLGGEFSLDSEKHVGTTVSFELPLSVAEQPDEVEEDTADGGQRFDGLKVLIVEDNPVNQMVAKAVVTNWGAVAKVVDNGQKALDYVSENGEPDVILMDYHMPVMNGIQATKLLRRQGVTVPIIAVSAAALEEEVQHCYDAGMDDFLPKPLDRFALNTALVKWVQNR